MLELVFVSFTYSIPNTEKGDEEVTGESSWEHLRDDVQVGDKRRLEDDRDVGSVEKLDGVGGVLASVSDRFDWQIDSDTWKEISRKRTRSARESCGDGITLEVDDDEEDKMNKKQSGHKKTETTAVIEEEEDEWNVTQ